MKDVKDEHIGDLTLLLIYLSSWDENYKREYGDRPILRAWKGFRFDVLDKLSEMELISGSRGAKSVTLTEKGIERAKEILSKIQIGD